MVHATPDAMSHTGASTCIQDMHASQPAHTAHRCILSRLPKKPSKNSSTRVTFNNSHHTTYKNKYAHRKRVIPATFSRPGSPHTTASLAGTCPRQSCMTGATIEDKTGNISADNYLSQKTEPMMSQNELSKAPRKILIPVCQCPPYMTETHGASVPVLYGRTTWPAQYASLLRIPTRGRLARRL
jgi:hypothetical protein